MSDPARKESAAVPDRPAGPRMRRYLPPVARLAIIGSWGALLAVAVFYLLRKLGF